MLTIVVDCRGRRTTTTTAATPLDDDGADGRLASDQPGVETCEVARLKCAYRVGCGMALQVNLFLSNRSINLTKPKDTPSKN